jgi:hypothetical protein
VAVSILTLIGAGLAGVLGSVALWVSDNPFRTFMIQSAAIGSLSYVSLYMDVFSIGNPIWILLKSVAPWALRMISPIVVNVLIKLGTVASRTKMTEDERLIMDTATDVLSIGVAIGLQLYFFGKAADLDTPDATITTLNSTAISALSNTTHVEKINLELMPNSNITVATNLLRRWEGSLERLLPTPKVRELMQNFTNTLADMRKLK